MHRRSRARSIGHAKASAFGRASPPYEREELGLEIEKFSCGIYGGRASTRCKSLSEVRALHVGSGCRWLAAGAVLERKSVRENSIGEKPCDGCTGFDARRWAVE